MLPIRAADCRKGGETQLFRVVNGGHEGLFRTVPPELILRAVTGEEVRQSFVGN